EAREAVEEVHPGIDVTKRFADMRNAFGDALVTGWEGLEAGIILPDKDDRHVVAAAIRGGAHAIVTANLVDFPASALGPLGLEGIHPDGFLLDQLDLSPATVVQIIREQAAHTRNPILAPQDLAIQLARAGVPSFAEEILRLISPPLDAGS
ncbi:MAG: PIN domain-containing protein, partial [Nocardiopsaceae bacterium]|nr:PIN domain-containing protein [Nocardiopsaceae bacterium]